MAAPHDLVQVSPDELSSVPGFATIRKHSAKFPKRATSAAELRARQRRFIKSTPPPTVTQPRPKRVKAVRLTTAQLTKLRAVHESQAATAEMVAQKLEPDQTLGVLYSSIAALEYTKLKAERQRRLKKGEDRARVDAQWAKIVDQAGDVFAAGGLKNLTEAGIERMAKELSRSRANFNAVVDIANSATDVAASGGPKLAYGNFVTVTDRLADFLDLVVVPDTAEPLRATDSGQVHEAPQCVVQPVGQDHGVVPDLDESVPHVHPDLHDRERHLQRRAPGQLSDHVLRCNRLRGRVRADLRQHRRHHRLCFVQRESHRSRRHREVRVRLVVHVRAGSRRRAEMHGGRRHGLPSQRPLRLDDHRAVPSGVTPVLNT